MRIRLNRSSPNVCLTGQAVSQAANAVYETVNFNVINFEIVPVVANGLNHVIAQHNLNIPIRRVEVKTFTF